MERFDTVVGVDFSGAKLAGRNTWIARMNVGRAALELVELVRLEDACGTAERGPALASLTRQILASQRALWAMDFPFGLPFEVIGSDATWADQFRFLDEWAHDAYGAGVECLRRARAMGMQGHIRRLTDVQTQAPFDAYHYRIIYQTFHGMRDVLGPLRRAPATCILPFQYRRLAAATRVLVEACPSSTLQRLGLPHQNYKQPQGELAEKHRRSRRAILAGLRPLARVRAADERVMMEDPGGDALDAVIAAVGGAAAWREADHRAIARHPRYRREGLLFV